MTPSMEREFYRLIMEHREEMGPRASQHALSYMRSRRKADLIQFMAIDDLHSIAIVTAELALLTERP